mgnify:CR=1 FL=1
MRAAQDGEVIVGCAAGEGAEEVGDDVSTAQDVERLSGGVDGSARQFAVADVANVEHERQARFHGGVFRGFEVVEAVDAVDHWHAVDLYAFDEARVGRCDLRDAVGGELLPSPGLPIEAAKEAVDGGYGMADDEVFESLDIVGRCSSSVYERGYSRVDPGDVVRVAVVVAAVDVCVEVDEPWGDDLAGRVDDFTDACGRDVSRDLLNFTVGDRYVADVVDALGGVDDGSAFDEQVSHGCTSLAIVLRVGGV